MRIAQNRARRAVNENAHLGARTLNINSPSMRGIFREKNALMGLVGALQFEKQQLETTFTTVPGVRGVLVYLVYFLVEP